MNFRKRASCDIPFRPTQILAHLILAQGSWYQRTEINMLGQLEKPTS